MKLQWNVYRINHMKNKVEVFNVFDHWSFRNETIKILKESKTKTDLSEELRHSVFYYFGWKYEYEICITSVFSRQEETEEKIDIRHQLMLNWDRFIDYLWNNKEEILNV